jgi:hypothetical protein
MLMAYEMAGQTQAKDLPAVLTYMNRLNSDLCNTYVMALLRRDYKSMLTQPAMQAWAAKNSGVIAILGDMTN